MRQAGDSEGGIDNMVKPQRNHASTVVKLMVGFADKTFEIDLRTSCLKVMLVVPE